MQFKEETVNLLKTKKGNQYGYPCLVDESLTDIVNNKLLDYSDIIRMSTSDRNKAKSSIKILTSLYYKLNLISQRLYEIMASELKDIDKVNRRYLIRGVADIFNESFNPFVEKVLPFGPGEERDSSSADYVLMYQGLMAELLRLQVSKGDEATISAADVIDIIIHGDSYYNIDKWMTQPKPNSMLVTHYLNHLDIVNDQLKINPISYLERMVQAMDYSDGVEVISLGY